MDYLNHLYQKVFGSDRTSFDSVNHYYTVLMTFGFSESVGEELDRYIGPSYLKEHACRVDCPDAVIDLVSHYRQHYINGVKAAINYALLWQSDALPDKEQTTALLKSIQQEKNTEDHVTLIILLSEDTDAENMKRIEALLPEKSGLYLVKKDAAAPHRHYDDICGILLLNSDKTYYEKVEKNFSLTDQAVNTNVAAMLQEGQELLSKKQPILWSTVSTTFHDVKMDFLRKYMYSLCNKAKLLDEATFNGVCTSFFEKNILRSPENEHLSERLRMAVNFIPMRNGRLKKNTSRSIDAYCRQAYGESGKATFDATLRLNLLNLFSFSAEEVKHGKEAVEEIFQKNCSRLTLRELLDGFLTSLRFRRDELNRNMEQYIYNSESDYDEALQNYIRKYIDYQVCLAQIDFFEAVKLTVSKNEVSEAGKQLDVLKGELSSLGDVQYDAVDGYFSADELLHAAESAEIIEKTREAFKAYDASGIAAPQPFVKEISRFFNTNPSFIINCSENIAIHHSYTAHIEQRIGKYFMFQLMNV